MIITTTIIIQFTNKNTESRDQRPRITTVNENIAMAMLQKVNTVQMKLMAQNELSSTHQTRNQVSKLMLRGLDTFATKLITTIIITKSSGQLLLKKKLFIEI